MTRKTLPYADLYHVGPHKTASTSLHRYLLPLFKNAEVLKAIDGPVYGHEVIPVASQKGIPLIYTNESLVGSIYEPSTTAIEEIKHINPNAQILIVRRELSGWATSLYRQSVKGGETLRFQEFCRKLHTTGKLNIEQTIRECEKILPGQITVLDFDTVVSDPQTTLKIIAATLNLDEPKFDGNLPRLKQSAGDLTVIAMRLHNSRSVGKVFFQLLITICRIIDSLTKRKIRIFQYASNVTVQRIN